MEKFVSFVARVRYIEIFFLKGKKNLVSKIEMFVISGVRNIESSLSNIIKFKIKKYIRFSTSYQDVLREID